MNDNFFDFPSVNPNDLSPAVWAYVGDALYELFVRNDLALQGPSKTGQLHQFAVKRVRAGHQADLLMQLEDLLSEEEMEIVRRGRNVKSGHVPKASDVVTYRHSTAFEGLLGYLYLSGRRERLLEILKLIKNMDGGGVRD